MEGNRALQAKEKQQIEQRICNVDLLALQTVPLDTIQSQSLAYHVQLTLVPHILVLLALFDTLSNLSFTNPGLESDSLGLHLTLLLLLTVLPFVKKQQNKPLTCCSTISPGN